MIPDVQLTHEELQQTKFLLGPWFIGSILDFILQGILFSQFKNYFTCHFEDRLGTKLAVGGLLILTTLKSVHSFATVWIMFIYHFKDLQGAILLNYTAWWQTGSSLMVASIGIYVQAYFCYRLWVVSKKNYFFVVPIALVLLFAYLSICVATYYISLGASAGHQIATWFAAHLSAAFAGDFLITMSTAYFLVKAKDTVLPQTVGLIQALVRLTFQTAAPAALCAMLNLIFSQVYSGNDHLISVLFNQMLPKLYAFSMMWTLNARRELRGGGSGSRAYQSTNTHSGGGSRRVRGDMELGVYNNTRGLHVHTLTEVSEDPDVKRVPFHAIGDRERSHSGDMKVAPVESSVLKL